MLIKTLTHCVCNATLGKQKWFSGHVETDAAEAVIAAAAIVGIGSATVDVVISTCVRMSCLFHA